MRALRTIRDILAAEATVVSFVVLNAVAIFMTPLFAHGSTWERVISHVDFVCVLYFMLESAIKINRDGWRGYIDVGWNRFDFLIVLCSLPVLLEPFVDLKGFGIVMVLRLGRLFRLFRVMQFIPNLDRMAAGIGRALRASVGVLMAIVIVNIIFALGGTLLFGEFAPKHFGNPLMSMYTTFKVFTVEGWYEIPDMIAANTDSDLMALGVRVYYVVAVVVGGLIGLSLANAVFIDEMTADNNKLLEEKIDELSRELRELKGMLADRENPRGSGRARRGPRT